MILGDLVRGIVAQATGSCSRLATAAVKYFLRNDLFT